jgi:hypothetical protein
MRVIEFINAERENIAGSGCGAEWEAVTARLTRVAPQSGRVMEWKRPIQTLGHEVKPRR